MTKTLKCPCLCVGHPTFDNDTELTMHLEERHNITTGDVSSSNHALLCDKVMNLLDNVVTRGEPGSIHNLN